MAVFLNGQLNTYDYIAKESQLSLQKMLEVGMIYKSATIF